MRGRVTRITRTAIAATSCTLVAAASAQAAQVNVDRPCYPGDEGAPVKITGSGYAPNADFLVLLNGGVVGTGTADAAGNVAAEVEAPAPPQGGKTAHDKQQRVEIRQGQTTAGRAFRTAGVFGDFNPGSGDPKRLKVRFSAFGFGIDTPRGKKQPLIYVHYVDRKGRSRKTIKLGRGKGACGSIRRTARRKLFPFRPSSGRWTLQFDTNRKYKKGSSSSKFPWDAVTLSISR